MSREAVLVDDEGQPTDCQCWFWCCGHDQDGYRCQVKVRDEAGS